MQGHSELNHDEAIVWVNAAETYVDVFPMPRGAPGRVVNFISEGGMMEFFMIGASRPRQLSKRLATITGY